MLGTHGEKSTHHLHFLELTVVGETDKQGKEQIYHGNFDMVMKGMISVLSMEMRAEASLRWGRSLLQKSAGIPEWA